MTETAAPAEPLISNGGEKGHSTAANSKKTRAAVPNDAFSPDLAGLRNLLSQSRKQAAGNDFANPILLSAVALDNRRIDDLAQHHALDQSIESLTLEAFETRAERLRAYLGDVDVPSNTRRLSTLIDGLALGDDGKPVAVDLFAQRVDRVFFGFVFTAHPTFSLDDTLQADLMSLATGTDQDGATLSKAGQEALLQRVRNAEHRPDDPMTLTREHEKAAVALDNLHAAVRILLETIAERASEHYPADWHKLRPRLISIATWVGYDLDGRSDIGWSTSVERRMAASSKALQRFRTMIADMLPQARKKPALAAMIGLIDAKLTLAWRTLEDERAKLRDYASDPVGKEGELAALSRSMLAGMDDRLCKAEQLTDMIEAAMAEAEGTDVLRPLWVLASLVRVTGLADAKTHVRINSVQLHNAIRKAVGMEHAPDDAAHKLSYLKSIGTLIKNVKPETIHMGSVAHERATAKRVFASINLMLRFIDGDEPIRFLIAECETSFTLLTALYFAKMFGVERNVDISPLFETGTALERGAAMIEDAIANPDYKAYLKGRGRLCLQTGFSDAGRYLGQTAASNAIERIRLDLVDLLKKHDLADIEVVIFDTHGESIGRGAHPGGFADRLSYYGTSESRRRFDAAGIRFLQESSFQGGDGYLYFQNRCSALAVLTRILEQMIDPPASKSEAGDPFYAKKTYVDEFFAAITHFNAELIDNPSYATLLDAFGLNLSYKSGSRAVKRQFDGRGPIVGLQHPSQIRAIPHNSILQQLGILANTIGGLGVAVDRDPETFQELYRESDRFRRLMAMVEHAFKYTDLTVVRAYIDIFDPGFWLLRAAEAPTDDAEAMMAVSHHMEKIDMHPKLMRVFRHLMRDHMHLADALREHRRRTRDEGQQPIVIERRVRDTMHTLHSLRIALIMSLFRRAVQIPDFSDRHDTTHHDAISHLMHLDVLPTVSLLKEVFPLIENGAGDHDFGEQVSYASSAAQSYAEEHERIFDPLQRNYETIRRVGAGLTHFIGSYG